MKQDYLWDKTGSDPEIESLEDLLSGYAYTATPPPRIAKEEAVPFFRRLLDLKVLIPVGAAAVAMIAFGLSFLMRTPAPSSVALPTVAEAPRNITAPPTTPDRSFQSTAIEPVLKNTEIDRPTVIRAAYRAAVKRTALRHAMPKLTKEEKFAYDQLMLALSITSSKLKIVRDAANGNENSDSPKTSK